MKKLSVLLLALVSLPLMAQDNIVDRLEQTVPGQGVITIHQDERLDALLGMVYDPAMSKGKKIQTVGYRIQVFSDNNQRTAKAQAQARERNISVQFPELRVYRLYKSPSWRVRVGDFKTRNEAEQVMQEIKEAFPAYASEVTIVVDKINLRER